MSQVPHPKALGWIAVAALSCAFAGTAQAEIYRWIDANGVINYSNAAPPPNVRATVVARDENVSTISVPQVSPEEVQALTDNLTATQRASAASQGIPVASAVTVGAAAELGDVPPPAYYPPRVAYPPTVRRINSVPSHSNTMRPVPYGIGAQPLSADQTVRYRETTRYK